MEEQTTKLIFKPGEVSGFEGPWEVPVDYPTMLPFTEVPLPEGLYAPKFDWNSNQWVDAVPKEVTEVLDKLQADMTKTITESENVGKTSIQLALNDMKQQAEINALKEGSAQ